MQKFKSFCSPPLCSTDISRKRKREDALTDIRTIFQSSCDTAPLASKVSSENLAECETFDFVNDTQSQVRGCYNTQSVQPKATRRQKCEAETDLHHCTTKTTELLCVSSSLFLIYCKTAAAPAAMKPLFSRHLRTRNQVNLLTGKCLLR